MLPENVILLKMFTQTVNVNAEEINKNHGLTATARPQEKHYHKKNITEVKISRKACQIGCKQ